jgi:hypothetical protein
MNNILFITFTFLTLNLTYSQLNNENCECVKNTYTEEKVDTVFNFTNGKNIVRNNESGLINYSEFVLYVCGEQEIIDFWVAQQTCNVNMKNDTLYVEELINLPNGKNFKLEKNVWGIEKYYFESDKLDKIYRINKDIKKYNNNEIDIVLKEFESKTKGLDDDMMELANKLFICAISGSKIAMQYFIDFETKFGILDGAFREEYSDLKAMLDGWNKY